MSKISLRKIYLYLFSMVGLILVIIGAVGFINLGLQLTIFRDALQYKYGYLDRPPEPYFLERVNTLKESEELTEQDKEMLKQWEEDYKKWQESQKKGYLPYVENELSRDVALLIVGIPLYLYHWSLIKKEGGSPPSKEP